VEAISSAGSLISIALSEIRVGFIAEGFRRKVWRRYQAASSPV
jgi:hypothetical protein